MGAVCTTCYPFSLLYRYIESTVNTYFFQSNMCEHKEIINLLDASTVITSKAPLRVDCGGTWDLPALALPATNIIPITVNLTLSLYVTISVSKFEKGLVHVESLGFGTQTGAPSTVSYNSPLGFVFLACSLWGISGLRIRIESDVPPQSGLGGSAAIIVALISALEKMRPLHRQKTRRSKIAILANRIESCFHVCGLQDHVSASYGGINAWQWRYDNTVTPYLRRRLVRRTDIDKLRGAIALAYTGQSHNSGITTKRWVRDFFNGSTRSVWIEANQATHRFANCLSKTDLIQSADVLRHEAKLRTSVCPDAITEEMHRFTKSAEEYGCGARFAGGGNGGCVWAIGEQSNIFDLKKRWEKVCEYTTGAMVIDCDVISEGVSVNA